MKKLYLLLLTSMVIACSNSEIEDSNSKIGKLSKPTTVFYEMIVEAKDGVDSLVQIEYEIDMCIVDSLKLSEKVIKEMCETAARYSDWDVKNKRTYRFDLSRYNKVSYNPKIDSNIWIRTSGIASNSFGVDDNVTTTLFFDIKGKVIKVNIGDNVNVVEVPKTFTY
jgi:hypothetical protein